MAAGLGNDLYFEATPALSRSTQVACSSPSRSARPETGWLRSGRGWQKRVDQRVWRHADRDRAWSTHVKVFAVPGWYLVLIPVLVE